MTPLERLEAEALAAERPLLVVLAGLPGSGKSWFRERFLASQNAGAWAVLSTDDLIEEAAAEVGASYDAVKREAAKPADKRFRRGLGEALEGDRHILIDRTNLASRRRRALVSRAEGRRTVVVWFDPPEAERRRRLGARPGKTIPRLVEAEMRQVWTPPTPEEGFDTMIRGD